MNTVGKECAKKIKQAEKKTKKSAAEKHQHKADIAFLKSSMEAVKSLHELNIYINAYKTDSDYMANVRKICEQIKNMRTTEGLESDYGQLEFEGRMKFKRETEPKFEENCYLMCFHSRILIFEIEEPEYEKSRWLFPTDSASSQATAKENYVYIGSVKVNSKMALLTNEDNVNRKDGILTINSHTENFEINKQDSFSVAVSLERIDELKKKFQQLIDLASERPTSKHRMHEYHKNIPKHDINFKNPLPPPSCGECGLYIFGLLFTGYKCDTCNECYHKDCFIEGMPTVAYGM